MNINLSREEKQRITPLIREYFEKELNESIGAFDAEFLLDFFVREVGPFIYNRAIYDAQSFLKDKLDELQHGLFELEQHIPD